MTDAPTPEALRSRTEWPDARLLAECEIHTLAATGPGGQKRNRTRSAVRLRHTPSGLVVKAAESRSQAENRAHALRRLRRAILMSARTKLPDPVVWPQGLEPRAGRLSISPKNPRRFEVVAILLDALHAADGRLSEASTTLGISGSNLVKVLSVVDGGLPAANRIRTDGGLAPLRR